MVKLSIYLSTVPVPVCGDQIARIPSQAGSRSFIPLDRACLFIVFLLLAEAGNVTSECNSLRHHHFRHVLRTKNLKSDNVSYKPRATLQEAQ
jgi:hypothetical protein